MPKSFPPYRPPPGYGQPKEERRPSGWSTKATPTSKPWDFMPDVVRGPTPDILKNTGKRFYRDRSPSPVKVGDGLEATPSTTPSTTPTSASTSSWATPTTTTSSSGSSPEYTGPSPWISFEGHEEEEEVEKGGASYCPRLSPKKAVKKEEESDLDDDYDDGEEVVRRRAAISKAMVMLEILKYKKWRARVSPL